jgi:hypothetical protein
LKILKNLVLGLFAVVVLLSLIALVFLPRNSKIERSLVINAPAEVILDQVNDLKKNDAWSPWKDSTMQITFGSITAGKGASNSWTSKQMGNGSQTIEVSDAPTFIQLHLDFGGMGTAKATWQFQAQDGGVKVTQAMLSDAGMNPAKRWMSLLSDKMVGPYFEKGLASLKSVSETRAEQIKAEEAAAKLAAEAAAAKAAADSAAAVAAMPKGKKAKAK